MPAQTKPYPVVTLLIDTFANWLHHRRELNETRQMDRSDFDRIAGELRTKGVYPVGRYGGWTYCSIEDNIVEARALVARF